jgi:hypothetical protein
MKKVIIAAIALATSSFVFANTAQVADANSTTTPSTEQATPATGDTTMQQGTSGQSNTTPSTDTTAQTPSTTDSTSTSTGTGTGTGSSTGTN